MGWYFRKSISILPGVRINLSTSGVSVSVGKGPISATYNLTQQRGSTSVRIPGTGLSYHTSYSTKKNKNSNNNTSSKKTNNTAHDNSCSQNNCSTSGTLPSSSSTSSIPTGRYGELSSVALGCSTSRSSSSESAQSASMPTSNIANKSNNDSYNKFVMAIRSIYRTADPRVDWYKIRSENGNVAMPNFAYFKARADKVLNGDIDTYLEVIRDVNPFDDLLRFGSGFQCGSNDPRIMAVHFEVNSDTFLRHAGNLTVFQCNELLQDYVCGTAIRVARDMMALLPVENVIIDATDRGVTILSVNFLTYRFFNVDFASQDASDFVETFEHNMVFSKIKGFEPVASLL